MQSEFFHSLRTRTLTFCFLFLTCHSFLAQKGIMLLDTGKIKPGTILIGRYLNKEAEASRPPLNFIVENPDSIKKLICATRSKKKVKNYNGDDYGFSISVLQGYDEVNSWWVTPALNKVLHEGHEYYFDMKTIQYLHLLHPFKWKSEEISFKTREEYDAYFEKQKSDPNFLFVYSPEFKYEGNFEIEFPKTKEYESPLMIFNYLTPKIEAIVGKQDYNMYYPADSKNMSNFNQYTITICGPKSLFEKLSIPNLKNQNWQYTDEKGEFFYRIN